MKRGFIVYAPQNLYRGGDAFRELQPMLNPLGRSLFSYIIAQRASRLVIHTTIQTVGPLALSVSGKCLSWGDAPGYVNEWTFGPKKQPVSATHFCPRED